MLAACAPADAADSSRTVHNAQELRAALDKASKGSSILLAPGDYGDIVLRKIDKGGPVLLAAANPSDKPRLSSLIIENSSDLTIRGLAVQLVDRAAVAVGASQRIRFEDMLVRGQATETSIGGGNGMTIKRSSDVSVIGSEFRNLGNGISHRDAQKLLIQKNRFHDIRVDGIHGSGTSNITIANNAFWNFSRLPEEHPDAVQFWTTNAKASVSTIRVLNNLIMRADGGRMQGLFLTDQTKGARPYLDVVVRGNAVIGSMWHGLTVSSAVSPVVEDNLVVGYEDMKAWINVDRSTNALVQRNQATSYRISRNNTDLKSVDNKTVKTPKVGDVRALRQWYAQNRAELPPLPPDLLKGLQ